MVYWGRTSTSVAYLCGPSDEGAAASASWPSCDSEGVDEAVYVVMLEDGASGGGGDAAEDDDLDAVQIRSGLFSAYSAMWSRGSASDDLSLFHGGTADVLWRLSAGEQQMVLLNDEIVLKQDGQPEMTADEEEDIDWTSW